MQVERSSVITYCELRKCDMHAYASEDLYETSDDDQMDAIRRSLIAIGTPVQADDRSTSACRRSTRVTNDP